MTSCLHVGRAELGPKDPAQTVTPSEPNAGTQPARILHELLKGRSLDPLSAWEQFGVYRLADAVRQLRKLGWAVKTERKSVFNRFGEHCHVGNYSLLPEAIQGPCQTGTRPENGGRV